MTGAHLICLHADGRRILMRRVKQNEVNKRQAIDELLHTELQIHSRLHLRTRARCATENTEQQDIKAPLAH